MMIGGIILVGAAVFFLLILLAGNPAATTTTTEGDPTTTTAQVTTTSSTTSSSSTSSTTSTTVVPVRPPEEVHVVVLNSIGISGAAGRLTSDLVAEGYQTLPPDDYEPELDPSRIWYREGFSAEANELLAHVPDALVGPLPDEDLKPGADVVIVLGTGYEG